MGRSWSSIEMNRGDSEAVLRENSVREAAQRLASVHHSRSVRTASILGSGRSMSVHHSGCRERRAESLGVPGAVRAELSGCPGWTLHEQRVRPENSPSQPARVSADSRRPRGTHPRGSVHHFGTSKFVSCIPGSPDRTVYERLSRSGSVWLSLDRAGSAPAGRQTGSPKTRYLRPS